MWHAGPDLCGTQDSNCVEDAEPEAGEGRFGASAGVEEARPKALEQAVYSGLFAELTSNALKR